MVCSKREQSVKEKEQQLADQQVHLDKYAQMSAMIHSLTSGNIPSLIKSSMIIQYLATKHQVSDLIRVIFLLLAGSVIKTLQ